MNMIVNWCGSCTSSSSNVLFLPRRISSSILRRMRTVCLASINAEQLRAHLDQLHSEADNTRTKGSNARLRLMRLSEAAEKLQRQALVSVRTGRENDARDLLFQKKKIMQAIEKTKSRIELLDQLSTQLNKAISMKENQLVETVTQDLNISRDDNTSAPVRIVSPKEEQSTANSDENGHQNTESIKLSEEIETEANDQGPFDLSNDKEPNNDLISSIWSENDAISCLKGISSFENFLEHLDKQLGKIEEELATVLRFSTLVLDSAEKPKNSKLQHTMEIFEGVCRIRARIASIVQEKVQTR